MAADFYLVQESKRPIPCLFFTDTRDFALGLKNWRGKRNRGDVINTDDVISLVPLASDRARLSVRAPGGYVRASVIVYAERPTFSGAPAAAHFLAGTEGDFKYYVYLLDASYPKRILVQRFMVGGRFQAFEPTTNNVIKYPGDPDLIIDPNWLLFLEPGSVASRQQDDEGSGEEPIP